MHVNGFLYIHGFTKLSATTVNGYCYHYMINDHCSVAIIGYAVFQSLIQYLTYSISSSWGNKLSLLFANTYPFKSIAATTANPPNTKQ